MMSEYMGDLKPLIIGAVENERVDGGVGHGLLIKSRLCPLFFYFLEQKMCAQNILGF